MPAKLFLLCLLLPTFQPAEPPIPPTGSGVHVIALRHLPADKAAAVLRGVYPIPDEKSPAAVLRVASLDNRIVLAGPADLLHQAADLVARLDQPRPAEEPVRRYRARVSAIRWEGPSPADQDPWTWLAERRADHADRLLCDVTLPIAERANAAFRGGKTDLELSLRCAESAEIRLRTGELQFNGAIPLGRTVVLGDAASGWIVAEIQPIK